MDNEKVTEKDLNEARRIVIEIGSLGIVFFGIAIAGAILVFYLGKMPEYTVLRIVILLVSVIFFILGLVVLPFFRDFYGLYTLIKDHLEGRYEDDEEEEEEVEN